MSQETQIQEFINISKERAIDVYNKGNKLGAAYLACIFGAYIHSLKLPNNLNPFSLDYNFCYNWFNYGFDLSRESIKQDENLRRIYKKYEDEQEKVKKKKKFWSLK